MRVGHYFSRIWAPGGVGSYIRRAGDWLHAQGHEVVFLTGRDDPELIDRDGRSAEAVADDALLRRAAESKLDVLNVHNEVDAALSRSSVPVVRTVLGHHPYCPSGSRYLRRSGRACDRHYHVLGCTWGHLVDRCGSARPQKLLADLNRPRLERRTLAGIRVVAVSQFIRDQMVAEGYEPTMIDVLHLPIRDVAATPRQRPGGVPRLLFAGRLAPEKGVAWLLRAFARAGPNIWLDVAGIGDEEARLKALASELGIADRVTFHGWVDEAGIAELMARACAVVFPSVWHEPFGLIAPEAMARGVPVIGSAVGGIPETIRDGHNGLLVRPNDEAALAAAINRLVADPALVVRLGEAGRRDALKRFGLDTHMRQLLDVYAKAIALARDTPEFM